jgi:hypothetical protein
MSRKLVFPSVLILLLSAPAFAGTEQASLERFTRSMAQVYTACEMCKEVGALNTEAITVPIKNYLSAYYTGDVPYWALPEAAEQIKKRRDCVFMISARLLYYKSARADYAKDHPEVPTPPALWVGMLEGQGTYLTEFPTEDTDVPINHIVTPSVVARGSTH